MVAEETDRQQTGNAYLYFSFISLSHRVYILTLKIYVPANVPKDVQEYEEGKSKSNKKNKKKIEQEEEEDEEEYQY